MGFLGFLKKKEKKGVIRPVPEFEFPILPPEEDLLGEEEELEIPSPPSFTEDVTETIKRAAEDETHGEMPTEGIEEMPLPEFGEIEKKLKLKPRKAIYVKINRYKNILGELRLTRNRLSEADDALMRVAELKIYKDKEFEKWRESLEDLQRKLIFVDRTIFGGN